MSVITIQEEVVVTVREDVVHVVTVQVQGPPGPPGDHGLDGWSPLFAIVSDGDRRVLQVADWTGGDEPKPATGQYVGATGLVSDIAEAVDIRGPQGATGATGEKGLDWEGPWNNAVQYTRYDAVQYQGTSYAATAGSPDIGIAPPDNLTDWQLLAAKGEQGEQGIQGETGPAGPSQVTIDSTETSGFTAGALLRSVDNKVGEIVPGTTGVDLIEAKDAATARGTLGVNNPILTIDLPNGTHRILQYATVAFTINTAFAAQASAGSGTLTVSINGTPVTGLNAAAVTTTPADLTATAANTVSVGNYVEATVAGLADNETIAATIQGTRT